MMHANVVVIPDYEYRPEQERVAAAVTRALADNVPLMVEAGTGTGKTLAYLLPALQSGKRVVVSTATRALQEQIASRDLPLAGDILGVPPNFVVLKGVSNYLCRRRWHQFLAKPGRSDAEELEEELKSWIAGTATGDRAEFTQISPSHAIWDEITTDSDGRLGPSCSHYHNCFVTSERERAESAQVIIVNHHLFLADLSLRQSAGQGLLPDYDAVLFDEAHQLEDQIAAHFGITVSPARFRALVRDSLALVSGRDLERGVARVESAAAHFFLRLKLLCKARPNDGEKRVALAANELSADCEPAWLALDTALEIFGDTILSEAESRDPHRDPRARLANRVKRARDDLATVMEQRDRARVFWAEVQPTGVSLRAALIDASSILPECLFPATPTAIFTSATLSLGGDFSFSRRGLGLRADEIEELSVASPFCYGENAYLYLPRDLPAPSDPDFTEKSHERIRDLCAITEGRALVLFTSHRALDEAARRLPAMLPYPVLVQGQAPAGALLDAFRETPSVLLATGAFWEGVDVPGPALSLLIMEKIPFASPGDPLVAARMRALEEDGEDPFHAYQLPQAGLALKQGFGRLIRKKTDRGIAAVLDTRLLGKTYGRFLLDILPPDLPRTAAIETVRRFWRKPA
jgi:ATP-dependent DNA helicase DinG